MSNERGKYEFNNTTILNALAYADYECQICGTKNHLEVHHLIPIWFVLHYCPFVAPTLIKSLANAIVLCPTCHRNIHKSESVVVYQALATKNLGIKKFEKTDYAKDRLEKIYGKQDKPPLNLIEIRANLDNLDQEQAYILLSQLVKNVDA